MEGVIKGWVFKKNFFFKIENFIFFFNVYRKKNFVILWGKRNKQKFKCYENEKGS